MVLTICWCHFLCGYNLVMIYKSTTATRVNRATPPFGGIKAGKLVFHSLFYNSNSCREKKYKCKKSF